MLPQTEPVTDASAWTVYNEILRQHPQWLPRLYEGFIWTRRAEEADGETPVSNFRIPAYSAASTRAPNLRVYNCRSTPAHDHNRDRRQAHRLQRQFPSRRLRRR